MDEWSDETICIRQQYDSILRDIYTDRRQLCAVNNNCYANCEQICIFYCCGDKRPGNRRRYKHI